MKINNFSTFSIADIQIQHLTLYLTLSKFYFNEIFSIDI